MECGVCSASPPSGLVDCVHSVLERLQVLDVTLLLLLGAEVELTILLNDLPHHASFARTF